MSNYHRPAGSWSADLFFVLVATTLGALAILLDFGVTPVRAALAIPLVLLLPGYALISVLFPTRDSRMSYPRSDNRGLGLLDRLLLGVLASVAIVPAYAYLLNFTPFGITTRPLLAAVTVTTFVLVLLALVRRVRAPADERFRVPVTPAVGLARYFEVQHRSLGSRLPFEPRSSGQVLLNVILVLSVVVLLGSVAYAMAVPPAEDGFTEMYLLTEQDGELVAQNYPESFGEAQGAPIHVAVENHEGESMEYTVVVSVQSVSHDGGETTVESEEHVDEFSVSVGDGETEVTEYELAADDPGGDARVVFLLFEGDAPDSPSDDDAYRSVHLSLGG